MCDFQEVITEEAVDTFAELYQSMALSAGVIQDCIFDIILAEVFFTHLHDHVYAQLS